MFITFEGIDGSGKSTQIKLLCNYLKQNKRQFLSIREPGGTEFAEQIREILLTSKNDINPITELMLFEAARADLTEKVIIPALKEGKIVISDRFFDSTTAYQGFGRGLDLKSVEICNKFATQNLIPDLTFYFHLPIDVAMKRRDSKKADIMEATGRDFFTRVVKGFLRISRKQHDRFIILDATKPKDEIFEEIKSIINSRIK
jgi:dTMP kinase